MDIKVFEQLELFIESQRWKYHFPLKEETRLYEDLRIYGDDVITFFMEFSKKFNVDVSNFMAADYFKGEGVDILGSIVRFITRKNQQHQEKRKTLTLGHLVKAIIAGRLDEEIINS